MLAFSSSIIGAAIPDEDEDKYWALRLKRLFAEDLTLGANPMDLIRPFVQNPFPAVGKVFDLLGLIPDLMDGITGGRTRAGDVRGLRQLYRLLPVTSAVMQWNSMFEDVDEVQLPIIGLARPTNDTQR